MKNSNLIWRLSCGFLCLWYLASVVGFDIHVDHHDDRSYLVSLLGSLSCEDIHPEDECGCCGHHCEDCEDIVELLSVTGTNACGQLTVTAPALVPVMVIETPYMLKGGLEHTLLSVCKGPPRSLLSDNCVLRV